MRHREISERIAAALRAVTLVMELQEMTAIRVSLLWCIDFQILAATSLVLLAQVLLRPSAALAILQ